MKRLIIPAVFLVFLVACATAPNHFTPPASWEHHSTQDLIGLLNLPNITSSKADAWQSGNNVFSTYELSFSDRFDTTNGESIIRKSAPQNFITVYPQKLRPDFNDNPNVFAWETIGNGIRVFMATYRQPNGKTGGVAIATENNASALAEYEDVVKTISF